MATRGRSYDRARVFRTKGQLILPLRTCSHKLARWREMKRSMHAKQALQEETLLNELGHRFLHGMHMARGLLLNRSSLSGGISAQIFSTTRKKSRHDGACLLHFLKKFVDMRTTVE